jgi:hypothetical protein
MIRLRDLDPCTVATVKRVLHELSRHPVKPNHHSLLVKLDGPKTGVIINPDQRDTENYIEGKDDPNHFHKWANRGVFKKVAATEKVVP